MARFLDTHNAVIDVTVVDGIAALAEKLVTRLGVQGALRMCQENSWDGVFRFIKGHLNNNSLNE